MSLHDCLRLVPLGDGKYAMRLIAALLTATLLVMTPCASFASAVDDANAGMDALNAGDYAKAVQLFARALHSKQLSSADAESAYVERGKAYLGEHANKLAVADFDHALKLNPDDQEVATLRAQAQDTSDTSAGATNSERDGTEDASTAAAAKPHFEAGYTDWQKGDYADAEEQLKQGLILDPYNAAANYYYADCLVRRGDIPDAVLPLRLAVQYGGDSPEGQMARDAAVQLAPRLAPVQGVAMGCAAPIAPPVVDGATTSRRDIIEARDRMTIYMNASDRFQSCIQNGLENARNQAAQRGYTLDPRLEQKYLGQNVLNNQNKQMVSAQFSSARDEYNAAHERSQIP